MDVISSFFENVKDKLTSPFFGTLSFVLIIHHWEFWYTLFNFDDKVSRSEKLAVLKCTANFEFTWVNLSWDIAYTVMIVMLGYLIVIGTRSLSLFIDYTIMPSITKTVVSKLTILRSEYDEVVKERNDYSEKYEAQRKLVREYSTISDEQTEQIKNKNEEFTIQAGIVNDLSAKINENQKKILKQDEDINGYKGNLSDEINKGKELKDNLDLEVQKSSNLSFHVNSFEHLFGDDSSRAFYTKKDHFPPAVIAKVKQLKDENKWDIFLAASKFLRSGGSINTSHIALMQESEIITHYNDHKFTALGFVISTYRDIFSTLNQFNNNDDISKSDR